MWRKCERWLPCGGLIVLTLLTVGLLAVPVSGGPEASSMLFLQIASTLPTRPRLTDTPLPPRPPGPQPVEPTATPTLTATPTPTPTPTSTSTPTRVPPTPTPTRTSTPTLTPTPTPTETPAHSGRIDLTFDRLGYGTKELNRNQPILHYRAELTGGIQIWSGGNYLDLAMSHSPKAPLRVSSLRVEINGRQVSAMPLTEENAELGTTRIELPDDVLSEGPNLIVISLETSATCQDPGDIVNVSIDNSSALRLGYQPVPYPADLSLYPLPFTQEGLIKIPTTIILPDQPTAGDLSAAATIAAGLGQGSGGAIDLRAIVARDFALASHGEHHLILIGKPDANSLIGRLALTLSMHDETVEPGQGVLQQTVSPWNPFRVALVVSGLDESGVWKASQALNHHANDPSLSGPAAIVTQLRTVPETPKGPPWMTLASLGYEEQTFYGAKRQDRTFCFAVPFGWPSTEQAVLVLKFSHATVLDSLESFIELDLNGKPFSSTFLDSSNASQGGLAIPLPAHLLRPGRNCLEIGVEMDLPGGDPGKCEELDDKQAWTRISDESEIVLPHGTVDIAPSLDLFPYPFSRNGELEQTLFILPDEPGQASLGQLVQLAARLGSPTASRSIVALADYVSEADEGSWMDSHLVLIGSLTGDPLLGKVNRYLPYPLHANSDILAPLLTDASAPPSIGLLEVANWPWGREHTLLVATGTGDEGVNLAVRALLGQTNRLEGNLAIIGPDSGASSGQLGQIRTYSIGTSSSALPTGSDGREGSVTDGMPLTRDAILLARRWWK